MLRENAVAIASVLAEKFAANKLEVVSLPNTPLASLMGATDRTATTVVDVSHPQIVEVLQDVVRATNFQPEGVSGETRHDLVQLGATMQAKQAVLNHVAAIRLFVIPAVKELYEATQLGLQDLTVSSLLNFEIKTYDLPLPLRNPAFNNLLDAHSKTPFDDKKFQGERMRVADVGADQLQTFFRTGSTSLDKDLELWFTSVSPAWLEYVWKRFFQTNNHITPPVLAQGADRQDSKILEAMIVFLFARYLVDHEPVENTAMKLSDYLTRAKVLRAQAAAYLLQTLARWKTLNTRGQVVLASDANTVVVNEPVYRRWVSEHVQSSIDPNEVLFGNLITKGRYQTIKELDANAVSLQAEWVRYVGKTSLVEKTSRLLTTKRILERAFRQTLAEIAADEESARVGQYDRELVLRRFRQELDQLKERDLECLQTTIMKLVCRARFAHIDAEAFLDDTLLIEQDHPTLSIREITAIATMNYVARWACSMMQVRAA